MNKTFIAAAFALVTSVPALAAPTVVFSEDFNAAGSFTGSALALNNISDNWSQTDYYNIRNTPTWSFGADTYYATNGAGDGGVLLNEGGGTASTLITGLVVGQQYTLSFNVFGDNIPGSPYGLLASIAGAQLSYGSVDQAAGFYGGTGGVVQTLDFIATSAQELLSFAQTTPGGSGASPIIDNVVITSGAAAVPEPGSMALLLAGLGGMGVLRRRQTARR